MTQVVEKFPHESCGSLKANSMAVDDLGPLLLTWFNFNPGMDK